MSDQLATFLADAAGKKKRMGQWDCGLWLADWYVIATGNPDPAHHLRGASYSDAEIGRHVRGIARRLGLKRTREPERSDIGVVSLMKGHLVGGIFTGSHWCVLIDECGIGAFLPKRCRFVAAWRVE